MTTARVPVPSMAGGDQVPGTATVRLLRLSGRQVGMWLDAAKTLGPVYVGQAQQELYADVGPYELLVQPAPPNGRAYSFQVQVGVGTTPETVDERGGVTYATVQQILAAERASLVARFADTAAAETISGAWDFTTPPTLNGGAFGGGGGVTSAQLTTTLDTRLQAERTASDTAYAQVGFPESITGQWDFEDVPTVRGVPLGTSTGTQPAAPSNASGTPNNPVTDPDAARPTGLTVVWWDTTAAGRDPVNWTTNDVNLWPGL